MKENTIPMIYGEDFKRIKQSYTGGAACGWICIFLLMIIMN